jgi:hypothetical protein
VPGRPASFPGFSFLGIDSMTPDPRVDPVDSKVQSLLPSGATFEAFVCTACGAEFAGSPSMTRMLAGSRGDPETPGLCWVCRHLHNSVVREAAIDRKRYAEFEKHWIE